MKKILFILAVISCMATTLVAQQKQHMSPKEYCDKQQAFITKHAKLTPEEAAAFFPIYFEFQQNKWKINKEARKNIKWEKGTEISDEKWKELVYEKAEAKIKIAKLEKSYIEKYLNILPARKILYVQRAEDAFQREIIKEIARKKKENKD